MLAPSPTGQYALSQNLYFLFSSGSNVLPLQYPLPYLVISFLFPNVISSEKSTTTTLYKPGRPHHRHQSLAPYPFFLSCFGLHLLPSELLSISEDLFWVCLPPLHFYVSHEKGAAFAHRPGTWHGVWTSINWKGVCVNCTEFCSVNTSWALQHMFWVEIVMWNVLTKA